MLNEKTDSLQYRYDFFVEDFNALLKYSSTHLKDGKPKPRTSPYVWAWLAIMLCIPFMLMLIRWYAGQPMFEVREPEPELEPRKPVGPLQTALSFFLVAMFALFIVLWVMARIRRWRLRRAIRTGVGFKNHVFTFSADGIEVDNQLMAVRHRWPDVSRVVFTKKQIQFYVSAGQVVVLPRRALASTEDLIRISARLRKWHSGYRDRRAWETDHGRECIAA